jgi:hypothetical protein
MSPEARRRLSPKPCRAREGVLCQPKLGNKALFPQTPDFRVRSFGSPMISLFAQSDFSGVRQNFAQYRGGRLYSNNRAIIYE